MRYIMYTYIYIKSHLCSPFRTKKKKPHGEKGGKRLQ